MRFFLRPRSQETRVRAPSLSTRGTSSADCQWKNGCTASQQTLMFRRSSFPSYAIIIYGVTGLALGTVSHLKYHNCFLGFIFNPLYCSGLDDGGAGRGGSRAENGSSHFSWFPLRVFRTNPVYIAAVAPYRPIVTITIEKTTDCILVRSNKENTQTAKSTKIIRNFG